MKWFLPHHTGRYQLPQRRHGLECQICLTIRAPFPHGRPTNWPHLCATWMKPWPTCSRLAQSFCICYDVWWVCMKWSFNFLTCGNIFMFQKSETVSKQSRFYWSYQNKYLNHCHSSRKCWCTTQASAYRQSRRWSTRTLTTLTAKRISFSKFPLLNDLHAFKLF